MFSKLDVKHGYWSIKLDEESSKLTTFNSPIGCFRFKRLPFGLNVSQDAFQQCMDQILSQCPGTIRITDMSSSTARMTKTMTEISTTL